MFWSRGQLSKLKERGKKAQGQIQDLFIRNVVSLPGQRRAWGQFFNESNDQHGIYGTSAGIQVLSKSGYPYEAEFVKGSSQLLKEAWENNTSTNRFHKKRDTSLIYKLVYIVDAHSPDQPKIDGQAPLMEELINRSLPSGGWGEYYYSEADRDGEPKILATSIALLSLARYRPFIAHNTCEKTLKWLCQKILESHGRGTYEIALAGLALLEYDSLKNNIAKYKEASEYCRELLFEWIKDRKWQAFDLQESHHYTSSFDGSRGNKYLFFLPHCLVALYLIKIDAPLRQRRYLLRVISFFIDQVLDKKGFAPASSRRVSTVDHLWIFKLLKAFEAAPESVLLPQPVYIWSTASRLQRAIYTFTLLIIGLVTGYVSQGLKNSLPLKWSFLLGAVSTISLALFGRMIWEFYMNKKGDGK